MTVIENTGNRPPPYRGPNYTALSIIPQPTQRKWGESHGMDAYRYPEYDAIAFALDAAAAPVTPDGRHIAVSRRLAWTCLR